MLKNRYLILLLLIFSISIFAITKHIQAESGPGSGYPTCSTGMFLVASPTSGQIISGNHTARLSANSQIPVLNVTFYLNDAPIGPATYSSTVWERQWNSALFSNNNNYYMKARVNFYSTPNSTTSQTCDTYPVNISINNQSTTTQSNLVVAVRPEQWSGPTNILFPIEVTSGWQNYATTQNVTSNSNYEWSTSIGSIQGTGPSINFNSGPIAGSGVITLKVSYSGKNVIKTIPINVSAYQSDSTVQNITTNTPNPASPVATNTVQNSPINKLKEGDSQLNSCLQQKLGQDTTKRLTYQQFIKTSSCFEARKNIIPANLAPIPPEIIEKLPQINELVINKPTNPVNSPNKLVITGKAGANQQVFIYIFSEPLVLSAKADSSGNWSYTLEDPLEPGEHKAYVAVESPDGRSTRSSASLFGVVATTSSSTNPKGLSLALKNNASNSTFLYIGSSLVLITFAGIGVLIIRRLHTKKLQPMPAEVFGASINPTQAGNSTQDQHNLQQIPNQNAQPPSNVDKPTQ